MAFGFHGGPFDPGGFDGGRFRTGGTSAALAFGTLAAVATGLALAQGHSSTIVAAPTVPAPLPPPEPVVVSP